MMRGVFMRFFVLFFGSLSIIFSMLLVSDFAHASTSSDSTKNKKPSALDRFLERVSGVANFNLVTDMRTFEDPEKTNSTTLEFSSSYSINKTDNFSLFFIATKNLNQDRELSFSNTMLSWGRSNIFKWNKVNFSNRITLVYPTNKNAKVRDELIAGIQLSPTFTSSPINKLSVVYIPRLIKNFHKFKTNRENSVNTEYQIMQVAALTYQFNDKFSFSPTLLYFDSWSYFGTQKDDVFLSILQLSYNYSKNVQIGIGMSNSGAVYTTEFGPDQNLQFYDENSSTVYTNMSLAF